MIIYLNCSYLFIVQFKFCICLNYPVKGDLGLSYIFLQDLPENLNMAKMCLSNPVSEKSSTLEKDEDRNGICI